MPVTAADMLLGAAKTKDPDAGLPPDSKIAVFIQQMDTACEAEGTVTLTDVGATLVMIDPSLYDY
jgi:hypothetical protein